MSITFPIVICRVCWTGGLSFHIQRFREHKNTGLSIIKCKDKSLINMKLPSRHNLTLTVFQILLPIPMLNYAVSKGLSLNS